ncbi:MAG: hypothetical protein AB1726_07890 [Planctomycetota bacterium]
MKKNLFADLALALCLGLATSCASGPRRLSRTWDDYVNQKYTENAWVHGALLQDILPVYTLVGFVMTIGDVLFVNPYYFWTKDAWDNKGTGYDHVNPKDAEKTVTGYTNPKESGPDQ